MPLPIDKNTLIEILKEIDNKLKKPLVLIAIGGTGLNLIGLKNETLDIDFIIESDSNLLHAIVTVAILNLGYETQIQRRGKIVTYNLPSNYVEKSITADINKNFKNLTILILSPLDILISKLGRYVDKDIEDIARILLTCRYPLEQIEARFKEFYDKYGGDKKQFTANFEKFKRQYKQVLSQT